MLLHARSAAQVVADREAQRTAAEAVLAPGGVPLAAIAAAAVAADGGGEGAAEAQIGSTSPSSVNNMV